MTPPARKKNVHDNAPPPLSSNKFLQEKKKTDFLSLKYLINALTQHYFLSLANKI